MMGSNERDLTVSLSLSRCRRSANIATISVAERMRMPRPRGSYMRIAHVRIAHFNIAALYIAGIRAPRAGGAACGKRYM